MPWWRVLGALCRCGEVHPCLKKQVQPRVAIGADPVTTVCMPKPVAVVPDATVCWICRRSTSLRPLNRQG